MDNVIPNRSIARANVPPLLRLRTLQECQVTDSTIQVFVTEVPSKYTKTAIDAITPLLPDKTKSLRFLFYLRRVCLVDDLPEQLKAKLSPSPTSPTSPTSPRSPVPPGSPTAASPTGSDSGLPARRPRRRRKGSDKSKSPDSQSRPRLKLLWLLLCPSSLVDYETVVKAVHTAFEAHPEFPKPRVSIIDVPEFSPSSPATAKRLSREYWPTVFKNSNPYGPNPSDVKRTEGELQIGNSVHHWMKLAKRVAEEGKHQGLGEPVGTVVVERSDDHGVRVVAVACDARRCGMPHRENEQDENVMGHAVMRAIALVGQKRRIVDDKMGARSPGVISEQGSPPHSPMAESPPRAWNQPDQPTGHDSSRRRDQNSSEDTAVTSVTDETLVSPSPNAAHLPLPFVDTPSSFLDEPMTFLEAHYFTPNTLLPRGYLCLNLEMYTTHEPCIMCSMALLHSRFGRVVFAKEMPLTGGLVAKRKQPVEQGTEPLKYGLFWRTELNWKFMCWQYGGGPEEEDEDEDNPDLASQLAHLSLTEEEYEVEDLPADMHA